MRDGRRAAIVGLAEWPPRRHWEDRMFMLEAYARLAREALADAGMEIGEVDGLLSTPIPESTMFGPSALAEYLGVAANFAEVVDLGGSTGAGMVWRAVAAIEAGACDTCLCLLATIPPPPNPEGSVPGARRYLGADAWGSPHG
ncbi:MAG: thiolase family protein, partial [Tepidiformaceae bacterium]